MPAEAVMTEVILPVCWIPAWRMAVFPLVLGEDTATELCVSAS